jgi:uncharacterized NAD-dependent epimerase/dehydratase family protein
MFERNKIKKNVAIFAEKEFGRGFSKLAEGVIRYGEYNFIGIIDSSRVGQKLSDLIKVDKEIPFLRNTKEALQKKADVFLIGVAPRGGKLPDKWIPEIKFAIENGMDIYNGMHIFLRDIEDIKNLAQEKGVFLWDTRKPPENLEIGMGRAREINGKIILTIGSDCAIGKMTTTIELDNLAKKQGLKSTFIPTGQTGIMIAGFGISIDACAGDFMSGACEKLLLDHGKNADYIFVEGQGSIFHLGYSGVTLGMLHGFLPTHMILCHDPTRLNAKDSDYPLPSIKDVIKGYEEITPFFRKAKVVGIALNLTKYNEKDSIDIIKKYENETGLPVTDPLKFGVKNLLDAIL